MIAINRGAKFPISRLAYPVAAAAFLLTLSGQAHAQGAPASRAPEARCRAFLGRPFEGAIVTEATLVPATAASPEYCRIHGEMPRDLEFEIHMPTQWNHRTIFLGGSGFDGVITPAAFHAAHFGPGDAGHYATIATNHGHGGGNWFDASFALDVEMLKDYAYLSVPRVLASAKKILRERYGSPFETAKLVYEGCSGGGRQALIQAQRYPDLFDGVIARAPASNFTSLMLNFYKDAVQLARPGALLSPAKVQAIGAAVLAKCDALDGLKDGVIARPDACRFDPVELACPGADADSCLTPPQVEAARAIYAPTNLAGGRYVSPGFLFGGESPTAWMLSTGQYANPLLNGYLRYMVTQDPTGDPLKFDPAKYTARLDQLSSMIDAVDPDLSAFRAHGGKLLLWAGLNDWVISANLTTQYYQSVVAKSGGQAAADEFVEYYTAPGVQHCAGGAGADVADLATPMFEWLEKGVKPSASPIIARRFEAPVGGAEPVTRPLCRYPRYPKYTGGTPSRADSFVCTAS